MLFFKEIGTLLSWVTQAAKVRSRQVAAHGTNTAKLASRIGDEVACGMLVEMRRTCRSRPRDKGVPDRYFAPVPDEITASDLPVAGTLPPALNRL